MIGFLLQLMSSAIKILLLLAAVTLLEAAITINTINGISDANLVFSGSIPTVENESLFFTYYGVDGEKDINNLKKYPLLIMVGNPGTSAQYYSLGGIGPVNLQNDMTLAPNPNRFTAFANLMFLDLPGCGFSFVQDPDNLPSESAAFGGLLSDAINSFVQESVLAKSSKMVIAGESTFIRTLPGLKDIHALEGLIHLSSWPEMYAIGRYYGIAGKQLGIYGDSERIAIDSTFTTCYNNIRQSKFLEAHTCLDSIFNFVEQKTKNINLFDIRLGSNLTEFLPMIQYYFSQSNVVSAWKAPTARLFESQAGYIANKTYVDLAKNYTSDLSQFMRDFFSVRHWFLQGQIDYLCYYKGLKNWLENELNFVEREAYRNQKLQDIVIDGKTVGYYKAVKQLAYSEIIGGGHHLFHDRPQILGPIFKTWLDSLDEGKAAPNISTE